MRRHLDLVTALVLALLLGACGSGADSTASSKSGQKADQAAGAAGADSAAGASASLAGSRSSTTLDPRGEANGLHCGLPTAGPPPTQEGMQTPPSTAFPEPVQDFPLAATLSPERGDPGDKLKISVTAGRPNALIVVLTSWSDGEDHDVRMADFADATGHAEFVTRVPKGLPPGQANIVINASFTVADRSESSLIREKFIVTGPGCS